MNILHATTDPSLLQRLKEMLGLTEGEQLEVYRAVVQLVKDRLSKARSV